jgi:transmembrane sensor
MTGPIERARDAEPSWDEVRERRVLTRVQSARGERQQRRLRTRRWAVGSALAAIVLVAGAVGGRWLTEGTETIALTSPIIGPDTAGRLALSDGSEIELTEGARVEVEVDSPEEVRLIQHDGAARYVVSHRAERRFVVRCDGVEVEVRGTRFWVRHRAADGAESASVEVDVEEGRVEVRRGVEHSLLSGGESLRVRVSSDSHVLAPEAVEVSEIASDPLDRDTVPRATEIAAAERPSVRSGARVTPRPTSDVASLLTEAEEARRAGRLDDAVRALNEVLAQLGDDPRAATAYFTLGRLERSRSRHAAAAAAFEAAYGHDGGAILAEDALAEATISWSVAGRLDRARTSGSRYLARYPDGQYLERVRAALAE